MELLVFHSRHDNGVRVTVVGKYENGVLKLSASRCSEKDQFIKKVGRDIAKARFDVGNFITTVECSEFNLSNFIGAARAVEDSVVCNGVDQKIKLIDKKEYSYILEK